MKILLLHNSYGQFSGEEAVVEMQKILLEAHGHTVECYSRSSAGIKGPGGKINAFFSGFYNARSIREVREMISGGQPDIVHIHNLFPLISPAILPLIKSLNNPSTHQLINSSAKVEVPSVRHPLDLHHPFHCCFSSRFSLFAFRFSLFVLLSSLCPFPF